MRVLWNSCDEEVEDEVDEDEDKNWRFVDEVENWAAGLLSGGLNLPGALWSLVRDVRLKLAAFAAAITTPLSIKSTFGMILWEIIEDELEDDWVDELEAVVVMILSKSLLDEWNGDGDEDESSQFVFTVVGLVIFTEL